MNRTPATRYSSADRLAFIGEPPPLSSSAKADDPVARNAYPRTEAHGVLAAPTSRGMTTSQKNTRSSSLGFLLVHRQHALGDQEAAEDVHAGKDQRDKAEAAGPGAARGNHADADGEQRTDHDHRGDRVGHRHQRRVQRRGYRPHHEIADEHRQHEKQKPENKG